MTKAEPNLQISHIDGLAKSYSDALSIIENEVKDLIQSGREMEGLRLYYANMAKIVEVHKALTTLYSMIYNSQEILKHYGSKRLKQFGYTLKPIYALVDKSSSTQEELDNLILKAIHEIGISRQHWAFNTRFITELEYMIKALRILIEPEFVPDLISQKDNLEDNSEEKYDS